MVAGEIKLKSGINFSYEDFRALGDIIIFKTAYDHNVHVIQSSDVKEIEQVELHSTPFGQYEKLTESEIELQVNSYYRLIARREMSVETGKGILSENVERKTLNTSEASTYSKEGRTVLKTREVSIELPPLYAVKFSDESYEEGSYFFHTQCEGVGLAGDIFILHDKYLNLLNRTGLAYEKYQLESNHAEDVWKHFGIDPMRLKTDEEQLRNELIKKRTSFFGKSLRYLKDTFF